MGNHPQQLGSWGERLAAEYLEKRNYTILARNYRSLFGELDLVAREEFNGDSCLVFVEVKTRTSQSSGYPEQAVTKGKWKRLLAAINDFQEEHPHITEDWRIDVIAIQRISTGQAPQIVHFENVINADD